MTLDNFFDAHYLSYNPSTARNTIRLYRYTFRLFAQWLGHRPTLDDLTNESVGAYLASLYQSGRKPASVNKERAQLVAVWNHAHKLGMIKLGPLVKRVRQPDSLPTALSVDQLRQLCFSFVKLQGKTQGVDNAKLMRACFFTQYNTAERIGAVLQLQWTDIANRFITFRGETRKCGTRSIIKSVPQYVIDSLEAIRTNEIFVFPRMKGTGKMLLLFDRLFKRAGVPRPKWKSSHLLRSTHATFLNLAGQDATESLGHSNSSTTKKSYLDPRMKDAHYWTFLPSLEPQ